LKLRHYESDRIVVLFIGATVKFELDNNNKVTGISFDIPNNDFFFEELKAKKIK
jgi:hypothetical protein